MSISIVNDNKLWGLIACHHYSPKYIDFSLRQVCEFLGQYLSVEIQVCSERELHQYRSKINDLQQQLKSTILKKPIFLGDLLRNNTSQLLNLFHTHGVAICFADNVSLMGQTPTREEVKDLVNGFLVKQHQEVFQTNNLAELYPKAEAYKHVGGGILSVSIFLMTTSYHVIWFRAEQSHVVNWAGNPQTNLQVEDQSDRVALCPRTSFELWQETVQNKSLPWQPLEIESAGGI
ncbi:MAG: GAF domain-containing protein [Synechococcaceae cyanobacterium RL_1_2]|nr:GAF domain-containing protein [Synechococcaceae cyanobacterium RL_1_2]